MSAVAALKGYRTQFLYSLHYILSNPDVNTKFKLEGIEDLDILDQADNVLKIIQVKNLNDPLVLSDIHSQSHSKTSFINRYVKTKKGHPNIEPIIVSFGAIGPELKNWKTKGGTNKKSNQFKDNEWADIKNSIVFIEVQEQHLWDESIVLLKQKFTSIDPVPTIDVLLFWLSFIAEKQQVISIADVFSKVERIAKYLSERIAVTEQYGIYLSALHLEDYTNVNLDLLKEEFYRGINARYAHIIHNMDADRPGFMKKIKLGFEDSNIVILQGVSGQGKSTLAYRYAYTYGSDALIYELVIQDNPEQSRKAVLAMHAMTKSLGAPVLFLIHTLPNSVEWLKIVQEFSVYSDVHFLITIRQEDLYKAQAANIKFSYSEVELSLSKDEAADIYKKISEKHIDLIHLDFEEAWIRFGEIGPLLEFIHTITKGVSLENTLKAQVSVLEQEACAENEDLLTLLRLVCLADTFGARVNLEKVRGFKNLQSIIKRLNKEYLVKVTDDNKYITGLHPLRSKVLLDNLFDEFVLNKNKFAVDHIMFIEDKDVYYFVLHLFHEKLLSPDQLLEKLKQSNNLSWTYYHGILKSLIWAGIDQYIIVNEQIFNHARSQFGDAWVLLIDLYFGTTSHLAFTVDNLSFISEEIRLTVKRLNSQLSNKDDVFTLAKVFLSSTQIPVDKPESPEDWIAYGEMAFWLNEFNHSKESIILTEQDYRDAFELLSVDALSVLMFGMTWQGEEVINVKYKYSYIFSNKLRERFNVPELVIDQTTIRANYIVDLTTNDPEPKPLNERSVEILLLLRKAFPEKKTYSSQGYGHRFLSTLDETLKAIPAESLPYEQWVEINSIVRKRFEYTLLPKNWDEYSSQLYQWEASIESLIKEFVTLFDLFYNSQLEAQIIIPLINNANYKSLSSIKKPKSISDPLGVYYDKIILSSSREKALGNTESKLGDKYKSLFNGYTDFSSSIENFIIQSGTVIYHKIKQLHEPSYVIEDSPERISVRNVFEAAQHLRVFSAQKSKYLSKFVQSPTSVVTDKQLFAITYIWKQFVSNRVDKDNRISVKGIAFINKLKADFELRLVKKCKARTQKGAFTLHYLNNANTKFKPILKVEIDEPYMMLLGLKEAFIAIKESLGELDYISLKYFMLEYFFEDFFILPIVQGKTLNNQWHRFSLYTLYNYEYETLEMHHWMAGTISDDLKLSLNIVDWSEVLPKIGDAKYFLVQFFKISIINRHLVDLKELTENDIDESGSKMINDHFEIKIADLMKEFQSVLDYLAESLKTFPFDKEQYESNTIERQYWDSILLIKDNIFPTAKGEEENYEIKLNMEIMEAWKVRLATCMEQVIYVYLGICGRLIKEVK